MSTIASGEFWAFVGVVAGIYTLPALGLQLEFGFAGLLNFGHVALVATGAYTMAILVVKADWSMWPPRRRQSPRRVPSGSSSACRRFASGRLLRDRDDAFSEIVRYVATNEDRLTGGSQGRSTSRERTGRRRTTTSGSASRLGSRARCTSAQGRRDARSRLARRAGCVHGPGGLQDAPWGRVLRAIREDEDVAAPVGKNVFVFTLQAMALGSALAGLAGCFYAWQFSFFSLDDFAPN